MVNFDVSFGRVCGYAMTSYGALVVVSVSYKDGMQTLLSSVFEGVVLIALGLIVFFMAAIYGYLTGTQSR